MNAVVPDQRKSVLMAVASRYSMEAAAFEATLRATVVPQNCSREQFAACLVVANEYHLNPLTKEIYFFPGKGGSIVPIVGVDGWCRIINEHPAFDGMEFDTQFEGGKPFAVTCRMFRKDRQRPISVTEYHSECSRPTDPWKSAPARMLRHKAMIQAARYAFGFSGIYDEDEAERIAASSAKDVTPTRSEAIPPRPPQTALQPPRPPSGQPPRPPVQDAPVAATQQPHEQTGPADVDWERELDGYDNDLASCEATEALDEAVSAFAGIFIDAPSEIVDRAKRTEAMHRERIARQDA